MKNETSPDSAKFIETQINSFITGKSKEHATKSGHGLLLLHLSKTVKDQNFNCGEQLLSFTGFKATGTICDLEIEDAILYLAQVLNRQFSIDYYDYRKQLLAKEQLPTSKEDYQRKVAWRWIVRHCANADCVDPAQE